MYSGDMNRRKSYPHAAMAITIGITFSIILLTFIFMYWGFILWSDYNA